MKGKEVCKIYGTYMGFIEFNKVRYWDYRHITPFKPKIHESFLGSDHSFRKDKLLLSRGYVKLA